MKVTVGLVQRICLCMLCVPWFLAHLPPIRSLNILFTDMASYNLHFPSTRQPEQSIRSGKPLVVDNVWKLQLMTRTDSAVADICTAIWSGTWDQCMTDAWKAGLPSQTPNF